MKKCKNPSSSGIPNQEWASSVCRCKTVCWDAVCLSTRDVGMTCEWKTLTRFCTQLYSFYKQLHYIHKNTHIFKLTIHSVDRLDQPKRQGEQQAWKHTKIHNYFNFNLYCHYSIDFYHYCSAYGHRWWYSEFCCNNT